MYVQKQPVVRTGSGRSVVKPGGPGKAPRRGSKKPQPKLPGFDPQCDASLDPWCVVELIGGERHLFGYAGRHAHLGGLSWMRSSPIVALTEKPWRAVTAGGSRYELGRRIDITGVAAEGEEALLAYNMLVTGTCTGTIVDYVDLNWLAACKMARHLGLDGPRREFMAVWAFMKLHRAVYEEARRNAGPCALPC